MKYKIAHISDIHIRNNQYHDNYKKIFKELYKDLIKEKVNYIFVLGDIAHTKVNLSAEYFNLAHDFYENLSKIAPVISILGNHDANLANPTRMDAVTPIIEAMNDNNITLLKYSAIHDIKNTNIRIYHLSVFDNNWPDIENLDNDKINIAFYHGPISGCSTDAGFKLENKTKLNIFKSFDYVFLGDIHKCQSLDNEGRIRYSGSLIQQDYGESYDKGYLIWELEDKNNFNVTRKIIENTEPFVSLLIENGQTSINHPNPPEGSRLRILVKDDLSANEIDKISLPFIQKIKPKEKRIHKLSNSIGHSKFEQFKILKNYRDPNIQSELIKEYFKIKKWDEKLLEKTILLNNKICTEIEKDEDVVRNITLDLEELSWSNLFSYGEGNKIDFKNLRGTIGVFGPNAIGKSSIIDSMLFSMFCNVTKNVASIGSIVNDNKLIANSNIKLKNSEQFYEINRQIILKDKKGKFNLDVNFYDESEEQNPNRNSNNGKSRIDTDNTLIRPRIGEMEDYLITSISSQGSVDMFLNMGSTEKKDYLIKILDIAFFDRQHELAKEKSKEIKNKISLIKSTLGINDKDNSVLKISKLKSEIEDLNKELEKNKKEQIDLLMIKQKLKNKIDQLNKPKYNIKDLFFYSDELSKNIKLNKENIDILEDKNIKNIEKLENLIKENINFEKDDHLSAVKNRLSELEFKSYEILNLKKEIEALTKQSSLLDDVPCGDQYLNCPLIKNAHDAKIKLLDKKQKLEKNKDIEEELLNLKNEISRLEEDKKISERSNKDIINTKTEIQNIISKLDLLKSKNETFEAKLDVIKKDLTEAEKEKELLENIEKISGEMELINSVIKKTENELLLFENKKSYNLQEIGRIQEKINSTDEKETELKKYIEEFESYEVLISCLSRNGVIQNILSKVESSINKEIESILKDVVPFKVVFDLSETKMKIFLQYPEQQQRIIELSSGMERMISSLAIRVALTQISSLPKLSTFIIDESFGTLDENNLIAIHKFFDILKTRFKNILIVSHIDGIKDMVDKTIDIAIDTNGFSYVNED